MGHFKKRGWGHGAKKIFRFVSFSFDNEKIKVECVAIMMGHPVYDKEKKRNSKIVIGHGKHFKILLSIWPGKNPKVINVEPMFIPDFRVFHFGIWTIF